MSRIRRAPPHQVKGPLYGALLLAITMASVYWAGFRVNISHSLEGKIWKITGNEAIAERGDHVHICFPDSFVARHQLREHFPDRQHPILRKNRCGGVPVILKRVTGIRGDDYAIATEGVWINGIKQDNSERRFIPPVFSAGVSGTLGMGELIVMGTHQDSLDSRYFGPISEKWVDAHVERIF